MVGGFRLRGAHWPQTSQTPLLRDVAVSKGAYTNLGSGGAYLKNLGLTWPNSPTVAYWRISNIAAVGGGNASEITNTCASNTANAAAREPLPSGGDNSNLTKTLNATSYTMTVTAVGLDGSEASCTYTQNVVANAFNVGDDPVRDGAGAYLPAGMATATGGKSLLLSTGADYRAPGVSPNGVFDIGYLVPSSGRTTVQYADPLRPSQIFGLRIINCHGMIVDGLGLGGGKVNKIQLLISGGGTVDDIEIKNCYPLGSSFATDVEIGGASNHSAAVIHDSTNVNVHNNSFTYTGRAFDISLGSSVIVDSNTVRYIYGDGAGIGDTPDCSLTNNIFASPMRDPFDRSGTPDHVDCLQFSNHVTYTFNIVRPIIKGNVWAQADGNCAWGGMQNGSDGVQNGLYANNIVTGHATTGMAVGTGLVFDIRDSTIFFCASGKVNNSSVNANDNVTNGAFQVSIQSDAADPTAHDNTMSRLFTSGSISSLTTHWSFTNNAGPNVTYPNIVQFPWAAGSTDGGSFTTGGYDPWARPTNYDYEPDMGGSTYDWSPYLNYTDALERLNNYHPINNPNGTNYAGMTCAQIKARLLLVLTPKAGGLLDLGGGSTIGAVKLDGTLKTA